MSASAAPESFGLHAVDLPTVEGGRMVSLTGRIDYRSASALRRRLWRLLPPRPAGGPPARSTGGLILELSGIESMDTAGVAVLLEALQEGSGRGLRVVLCQPSESVRRLFRLAGLPDAVESCCGEAGEAQARLRQAAVR